MTREKECNARWKCRCGFFGSDYHEFKSHPCRYNVEPSTGLIEFNKQYTKLFKWNDNKKGAV